jgi:hypothetical protein
MADDEHAPPLGEVELLLSTVFPGSVLWFGDDPYMTDPFDWLLGAELAGG